MISAAVFVSTPHILLKIQSTNFPFLKKCAHHYPQINISRVSHAFNILWWYQMYWFFFCLSLYSVSIYIRFYDDWHPFAEKKLSAMAAERIRTKKLLAEVTKDLTPEQINGKSVLVFKKIVEDKYVMYSKWLRIKKEVLYYLVDCAQIIPRNSFISFPEQKSYNVKHYEGPWNAFYLYEWIFCKYTSIRC